MQQWACSRVLPCAAILRHTTDLIASLPLQVRVLMANAGLEVLSLKRVRIGGLRLSSALLPGQFMCAPLGVPDKLYTSRAVPPHNLAGSVPSCTAGDAILYCR